MSNIEASEDNIESLTLVEVAKLQGFSRYYKEAAIRNSKNRYL